MKAGPAASAVEGPFDGGAVSIGIVHAMSCERGPAFQVDVGEAAHHFQHTLAAQATETP